MKLKIVPLGGARLSTAQAAAKIVDYLTPKEPASNGIRPAAGNGTPARYYADGGEEPGRWLGQGAAELGLTGTVLSEDLRNVLAGRDPATGERLITARGSAGRRPRLGVGSATRWGDGQFLYDERDTAAALGLERREATQLLDAGTRLAASRLFGWICGTTEGESGKPASQTGKDTAALDRYLVPVIDGEGRRWVTDGELARYEDAKTDDVSPADVLATGHSDELLPMAEAASLVGVTPRYLRELAKRYEDEGDIIDELVADGKEPQEAWLVAQRNKRGHWLVARRELAAYVERRDPPKVRVGFDATMTTEKSLSILALLAQPPYGKRVLDAIEGANDLAMGWIEAHGAECRIKGKVHRADGWTAATFRHLTSRALDPFVHHHNVIANTVTDRNGDRRALDARGLYRGARAASALSTAEVRWRLTAQLGVRWRPAKHGGWEIEGLTDEMLGAFSQRRNEIEDALRELKQVIGRGTRPEDVEDVVLRTRPAKQAADVDELRAEWLSRARALGLTEQAIARLFHQQAPVTPPNPERVYAALAAPVGGICEHLSVFGYGDLLKALVNMPDPDDGSDNPQTVLLSADKLEQLAQGFLRSNHVVPLIEKDELTRCVWTTAEILSVQDRIMSRYRKELRDPHAASVAKETLAKVLIRDAHLTAEQRNLVESFCTGGQRVQCGIGRAGAGKTTAMRTATEAWAADGWKVVGAAVKGEAARILAAETGIRTETLAWWLAHPDPATVPLDQHTVLIVDEASTIGDRDLDRLLWLTEQTGTTVRLIGDPAQHSSVPAGGMFRVLCNQYNHQTPELHSNLRLQDPRDRAAANALREGKIDEAFDLLNLAGHLHVIEDELDFYKDTLARWWTAATPCAANSTRSPTSSSKPTARWQKRRSWPTATADSAQVIE